MTARIGRDTLGRRLLASHADYLEAFDVLLALADQELRVFDTDLTQLELEAPLRAERLAEYLQQGSAPRLIVALHDPGALLARMPRTRRICTLFAPQVAIHQTVGEAARAQDCFALADTEHLVRRPVARQSRGVFLCGEPHEAAQYRERFDAIWESTEPAAPVTTLGL